MDWIIENIGVAQIVMRNLSLLKYLKSIRPIRPDFDLIWRICILLYHKKICFPLELSYTIIQSSEKFFFLLNSFVWDAHFASTLLSFLMDIEQCWNTKYEKGKKIRFHAVNRRPILGFNFFWRESWLCNRNGWLGFEENYAELL